MADADGGERVGSFLGSKGAVTSAVKGGGGWQGGWFESRGS